MSKYINLKASIFHFSKLIKKLLEMSTKNKGRKTGKPITDGIRSKNKKGITSSEYPITKI